MASALIKPAPTPFYEGAPDIWKNRELCHVTPLQGDERFAAGCAIPSRAGVVDESAVGHATRNNITKAGPTVGIIFGSSAIFDLLLVCRRAHIGAEQTERVNRRRRASQSPSCNCIQMHAALTNCRWPCAAERRRSCRRRPVCLPPIHRLPAATVPE